MHVPTEILDIEGLRRYFTRRTGRPRRRMARTDKRDAACDHDPDAVRARMIACSLTQETDRLGQHRLLVKHPCRSRGRRHHGSCGSAVCFLLPRPVSRVIL